MDALDKLIDIESEIYKELNRMQEQVYSLPVDSFEREKLDTAYLFLQRTFWNIKRVQEIL